MPIISSCFPLLSVSFLVLISRTSSESKCSSFLVCPSLIFSFPARLGVFLTVSCATASAFSLFSSPPIVFRFSSQSFLCSLTRLSCEIGITSDVRTSQASSDFSSTPLSSLILTPSSSCFLWSPFSKRFFFLFFFNPPDVW